jgi:3-deoxy-D-manno-octulosonate 8-phosphate phosphatase (KDO 8-P phosphatase)
MVTGRLEVEPAAWRVVGLAFRGTSIDADLEGRLARPVSDEALLSLRLRLASLGIEQVYQGQLDKRVAYERMKADLGLSDGEIAYVGDDVVDLPVMRRAGLAIAVQDAHPAVKRHAHWQTPSAGGRGAGRDVCELLMEARGVLAAALQSYLE